MRVVFSILMFVFGACFGSFLCCQARRLRRQETKKKPLGSRSVCPHCKKRLKWYENLPIISWLIQNGECNYCHRKIGSAEIISEISTAIGLCLLSTTFDPLAATPLALVTFLTTILLALTLIFLAIYDGLYGELPTVFLVIASLFSLTLVIFNLVTVSFSVKAIIDVAIAVLILGGLYLFLYLISKGKWVGDGDWILSSIIAAALGTPWLALIALFVANFSATIFALPTIKRNKSHKIFFGPFLVLAYILTQVLSNYGIINLW